MGLSALFAAVLLSSSSVQLPERTLRGYGLTAAEKAGDRVTLACADAAKAGLWAARYDHVYAPYRVRPGVYRLPGGGWTALALDGNRLTIDYSETEPSGSLETDLPPIPMFLNEYDDYAFRFYYRESATPPRTDGKDSVPWKEYDPTGEFDFAKASGDAGLVFWMKPATCDTAKGLANTAGWKWAKDLADARALPVVLNTSLAVPMWAADDYRAENETHAPGYVGSYHGVGSPYHAGEAFLSWASVRARQRLLDDLAVSFSENNTSNVINLLEPHGELSHGDYTVFIEHGPVVDASFRELLKKRYGSPAAVAERWGDPSIRRWDDVRLPEIAEFAGWSPDAIDLTGAWEVRDAGTTNAWGRVLKMPGHDVGLFLEKRPRECRRCFTMPGAVRPGTRTWLYVWDLSNDFQQPVRAVLNGRLVADEAVRHGTNHWMVREVTEAVRSGENEIMLTLPSGKLCYRAYLTHEEPKAYPYFGRGKNAKWIDFCAWQSESRLAAVRRGLDTLRAVEPDKTIVAMAPGIYFNGMRELAADCGTRFHDTGGMAAFWWEMLPALMRSKGLPFSLEPGGPARDREGFRRMTNFYMSEGVNAIHYFIHIGCVMWNPEIRDEFRRRLPALKLLGRLTLAERDLAMVVDSDINMTMGYPWRTDVRSAYPSGYMTWRFPSSLGDAYQMDAVTPYDFADGNASRYRCLLDANNTVMSAETVSGIERYVRDGGTYVAMFQSGRHSPEEPDRWLLGDLGGVKVVRMGDYAMEPDSKGVPRIVRKDVPHRVSATREGRARPKPFMGDGAAYEVTSSETRVLWRWDDGTAAITVRPLGKGRVVMFGLRPDNIYTGSAFRVLESLLEDLGFPKKILAAKCGRGFGRHYVTADGLYDVWYADAGDRAGPYELKFRDGKKRDLTDVLTGKPLPLAGSLEANGFVMGSSPRGENALAAWRWVEHEFGFWRGGERRSAPVESRLDRAGPKGHDDILDMSAILGENQPGSDYAVEGRFTVPANWTDGTIELWAAGLYGSSFVRGSLDAHINGTNVVSKSRNGIPGVKLDLKAGDAFSLRLEVKGDENPGVHGFRGSLWLYHRPIRATLLDLAGEWEAYRSCDDPNPSVATLPGTVTDCAMLRKVVDLPKDFGAGGPIRIVYAGKCGPLAGVVVNGHYLRRHHHNFGSLTDLDITPWIRRGEKNELILIHQGARFSLREIRLVGPIPVLTSSSPK